MWYFLLSDAFTFAGFLIAYGALRFSSPTWPVPDAVFQTAPFGIHTWFPGDKAPLIFVTFMSFLLIISSVTMVRAVQEGHRENQKGVVFWMVLTILGGLGFLGCQAWEWTNLIGEEHMTVTRNPFGTHTTSGVYLNEDGSVSDETFDAGETYLIHKAGGHHGEGEHGGEGGEHAEETHDYSQGDHAGYYVNEKNFLQRKYQVTGGEFDGEVRMQTFGPKAFGALFFFITGFHGFHVFSGVLFLIIIAINAGSGIYAARKNGYEMVEKIGLYWHFVDLVWVFVFLVFYLL
jgi:cytochrome c oxidase subunit 3